MKSLTPAINFNNPKGIFGIIVILFGAFIIFRYKKNPNLFLGLTWFFTALLPYSGIFPLNAMYLEHWLYVPMIGIAILIATFIDNIKTKKLHHSLFFHLSLYYILRKDIF